MDWFKTVAYNKRKMVKGMDNALARGQSLNEHMLEVFFEDSEAAKAELAHSPFQMDLVKDSISRDLGVPLHKIGHAQIDLCGGKGYQKHKLKEYKDYSGEERRGL